MKQVDDKIKFEYRSEVRSVLLALEQWQKEHPEADQEMKTDVKQMISFLDYMDMCW